MATVSGLRAPATPLGPRAHLPLLDSYIVRELAAPFAFSLGAFFLFEFVNLFFAAAEYIINAHAPPFLVLRFLLFRVPMTTPFAFPFACLFATLLAFGRMTADNEITAMRTAGIAFARIARTPLVLGVGIFCLSYYMNETIVPKSVEYSTRTFYQIVYHTATLPVVPQFFRKDDSTGRVFYVGNVEADGKTMDDVMIFDQATTSPFRQVINAEHAEIVGANLVLKHARLIRFKRTGEVDAFEQTRANQDISIPLPIGETADQFLNTATDDPNMLNSRQLKGQIGAMQATGQAGSSVDQLKITLAQKLSFPFASFIAVVIALPLAVAFGKKGRSLGIALSLIVLLGYYLMMSALAALGKAGAVNPYVAAWLPNVVFATAGAIFFWRVER